jgi:1-pyrroline-5-carboxylate dehydrogenase
MAFRITYSALNANMDELHQELDATLDQVKRSLGKEYPCQIQGKEVRTKTLLKKHNPSLTQQLLGSFHVAGTPEVNAAYEGAQAAYKSGWGNSPWQERAKLLRKAADLISERRLEIAAIMILEVGKSRLEALGDVEEAADLIRYYVQQIEETNGFKRQMGKLSDNENAISILRPYGVFSVIAPFNFPMALSTGMAAAALVAGNTVVLKPSDDAPWCSYKLYECMRDAGLPAGVFNVIFGQGAETGELMVKNPLSDGVVFTGSKKVGMQVLRNAVTDFPKPVLLELGGKNAAFVCETADLEKAVEGTIRSAFGLTGQKCSALSRVFIHESKKAPFIEAFIKRVKEIKIGNPEHKDTFMGPIINERAVTRFLAAVESAKKEGTVLYGGRNLAAQGGDFAHGYFVEPTLVEVPTSSRLFQEELFAPFLALTTFKDLPTAIALANQSEYGLTSGIFSQNEEEMTYFFDHIECGITYANRKTGATTGAWPGVQSFCGWKGSGAGGKGGCGPYYVAQFMREQSRTVMS